MFSFSNLLFFTGFPVIVAYKEVNLCCQSITAKLGVFCNSHHQIALTPASVSFSTKIINPVGYHLYKLSKKFLTRDLSHTYGLCKSGNAIVQF
jgi:hypothetical protein